MKYLPHFAPVGTKQSSGLVILANQVRFIVLTKYTTGKLGYTIAVTGVDFIRGNSIGSDGGIRVLPIAKIYISFGGKYNMSSNVEIDASSDMGDAKVCLGIVLARAADSVFFWLNVAVPISPTSLGYLTPIFFVTQID